MRVGYKWVVRTRSYSSLIYLTVFVGAISNLTALAVAFKKKGPKMLVELLVDLEEFKGRRVDPVEADSTTSTVYSFNL